MDLGAIRTAVETWVAAVTGLPVHWLERPQDFGAARMILHFRGFRGVGLDEVSEAYDATTPLGPAWGDIVGGYTPMQTGQRVGTLEIRCETQSQADGLDALYYVQLARDRLALPSCTDALAVAGAAVGTILMEPRELSFTRDGRRLSAAQMDLAINAAAAAVADTPYGTIESFDLTATGVDADGATVFEVTPRIEV